MIYEPRSIESEARLTTSTQHNKNWTALVSAQDTSFQKTKVSGSRQEHIGGSDNGGGGPRDEMAAVGEQSVAGVRGM